MSTWISWAIKAPAPAGYESLPPRTLDVIQFIVNHDAVGWRTYLVQGHRPGEQASWTFSNMLDGQLYQHFPLESRSWTSGGPFQNLVGVGVEHEGGRGSAAGPITPMQVATDQRLYATLKGLCPNLRPPVKGQGYREHSELTGGATTCPNGRIEPLYSANVEEDDMKPEDIDARITHLLNAARTIADRFVRADGQDEVYEIISGRRVWLVSAEVAVARGMAPNMSNVRVVNAVQLLAWPEGQL